MRRRGLARVGPPRDQEPLAVGRGRDSGGAFDPCGAAPIGNDVVVTDENTGIRNDARVHDVVARGTFLQVGDQEGPPAVVELRAVTCAWKVKAAATACDVEE